MGVERVGPLLWSGSVEVFRLIDGALSDRAFVWAKVESGHLRCYVVLQDGAIDSAAAAVRHVLAEKLAQEETAEAA